MNTSEFIKFPAPAKLNLFLHIVGRRADGYHNLETLFQFLNYGDTLEIKATNNNEIALLTPIEGVALTDNLIFKAAKILQDYLHSQSKNTLTLGAEIKIHKVLPMGGGLGGGSSNAATVLIALNHLWNTQLPLETLAEIGVKLGADVPIFIHGYAALAKGIGEKLSPMQPKEYWYLVSKPQVSISTQSVFQASDLPRATATLDEQEIDIDQCHNDCETFVIKHYSEVANLLAWLLEYAPSRMTGTGACIFSRFDSQEAAYMLQKKLPQGVESFVAQGINQSPLHKCLENLPKNMPNK